MYMMPKNIEQVNYYHFTNIETNLNKIIEASLPAIVKVVNIYGNDEFWSKEDLINECVLAVYKYLDTFDINKINGENVGGIFGIIKTICFRTIYKKLKHEKTAIRNTSRTSKPIIMINIEDDLTDSVMDSPESLVYLNELMNLKRLNNLENTINELKERNTLLRNSKVKTTKKYLNTVRLSYDKYKDMFSLYFYVDYSEFKDTIKVYMKMYDNILIISKTYQSDYTEMKLGTVSNKDKLFNYYIVRMSSFLENLGLAAGDRRKLIKVSNTEYRVNLLEDAL